MKVVSITAGCVGLASYVYSDNIGGGCTFFIYSTRKRLEPMLLCVNARRHLWQGRALSRSESSYDNLNGAPMDALPQK